MRQVTVRYLPFISSFHKIYQRFTVRYSELICFQVKQRRFVPKEKFQRKLSSPFSKWRILSCYLPMSHNQLFLPKKKRKLIKGDKSNRYTIWHDPKTVTTGKILRSANGIPAIPNLICVKFGSKIIESFHCTDCATLPSIRVGCSLRVRGYDHLITISSKASGRWP